MIEVVKNEVRDEPTRDRIARVLLERLHEDGDDEAKEAV